MSEWGKKILLSSDFESGSNHKSWSVWDYGYIYIFVYLLACHSHSLTQLKRLYMNDLVHVILASLDEYLDCLLMMDRWIILIYQRQMNERHLLEMDGWNFYHRWINGSDDNCGQTEMDEWLWFIKQKMYWSRHKATYFRSASKNFGVFFVSFLFF